MLFNSGVFLLCFLPVAVAGFFLLARIGPAVALAWLAAASLFFYSWWNPPLVALLLASIAGNYLFARAIVASHEAGREAAARRWMHAGVAADLLLLGYFKYANFFLEVVANATGTQHVARDIVLPLGISFFTFTQIAYLVDASRGRVGAPSPLRYLLFVTFFPHLIAGPLYHHAQVMPQFARPETFRPDARNLHAGLVYLAIGLFKKTIVADGLAPHADAFFNAEAHGIAYTPASAWIGILAFGLQLYFDFSGYSDMAVGLARMLNVRLPINFFSPYKSASMIEFWRRWHMTLSAFLRDYLYVPLGGNRLGEPRRYVNLLVTMVLGGLWHGAAWTFVAWGALHGAFLAVNHAWRRITGRPEGGEGSVAHAAGVALTFTCVMLAWVLFRAVDLGTAGRIYRDLVGLRGGHGLLSIDAVHGVMAAGLLLFLPNATQHVESLYGEIKARAWIPAWLAGGAVGFMAFLGLRALARAEPSPFLYFNF